LWFRFKERKLIKTFWRCLQWCKITMSNLMRLSGTPIILMKETRKKTWKSYKRKLWKRKRKQRKNNRKRNLNYRL
jgi:hypothetical protein